MMKYVRFKEHGFVLFDGDECHEQLARSVGGTPLSAGLVLQGTDGPVCMKESLSLGLGSNENDTALLRAAFKVV